MTKESMLRSLDSIREQIESVIQESPQLLSDTPTHDEISDYAAAINEISCAKKRHRPCLGIPEPEQERRKCMRDPTLMTSAELVRELRDCRNELCHQCGGYLNAHLGRCDGCRWKLEPKENAAP